MKGFGDLYRDKKKIKKKNKPDKEEIINKAIQLHIKGNIPEASKYYLELISQGCNDQRVFANYGAILQGLGKLVEAGKWYRKAIRLNPDFAEAHSNLGIILKRLGKLKEAELSTRKAIELKPDYAKAHNFLGSIYRDLGKLKEAELSTRKAIELEPDYSKAHYNLGIILSDLGKLKEAELSTRKAIEFNPNLAKAYYSLSLIKFSDENKIWQDQLFSENIFINKSQDDQIDIYFARANILHKKKKYEESSKYLQLANNLKLGLNPSNCDSLIDLSNTFLIESDKLGINKKEQKSFSEFIFIVGMPRSGSTLLESILSLNKDVFDLGETKFLGDSFMEFKTSKQDLDLAELYRKKINNKTKVNMTTDKNLYNYQYTGIIANQIPNAKIIHCFRNPLDNILSIYRTHFAAGHEFSSSLNDCARVYLDQEELMTKYKSRFQSKIYDFNYDLLVNDPNKEIRSLISWLGWKWDDQYLSPHLNQRSIYTASNVQVRSPINSKSVGGWKNYKIMLRPAIKIITKVDTFRDLIL